MHRVYGLDEYGLDEYQIELILFLQYILVWFEFSGCSYLETHENPNQVSITSRGFWNESRLL